MSSTMTEDVPVSPNTQGTPPNTTANNDPNPALQTQTEVLQVCMITSPPLHFSVNVFPEPPVGYSSRGAPPSYEEAIDPNAPPPSYESLYGRIRYAGKGMFGFVENVLVLFLGTIGCTITLAFSFAIPTSMMIIGGLYLHDCPQGEFIPIYLLVGGLFEIISKTSDLAIRVRTYGEEERPRVSSTGILLNCFLCGWFILGSIWVYREYEPNYDPALGKYCNKTLYLFAFWLITAGYIMIGLRIVFACIRDCIASNNILICDHILSIL